MQRSLDRDGCLDRWAADSVESVKEAGGVPCITGRLGLKSVQRHRQSDCGTS